MKKWCWIIVVVAALTGCSLQVDSPETPTVVASPTRDETAIALQWTSTPSRTPTDRPTATDTLTRTPTPTSTASDTPTPTDTATGTATNQPTATATYTPTSTLTRTPTDTPTLTRTPSRTPTDRPTATVQPTATNTWTPIPTNTATDQPTATWTPTLAPSDTATNVPTVTPFPTLIPSPTPSITPFPTLTPNQTATWQADNGIVPTRTPGGMYTLAPSNTPPAFPTATPPGTFYDPNATASSSENLPLVPTSESGPIGGPAALPEQGSVIISYAGQVVPLLNFVPGAQQAPTVPMAQGTVFSVSPTGQVAAASGAGGFLYVNGSPVVVSPASIYGVNPNLTYADLVWSPDGRYLAFRIDAINTADSSAINTGVRVYDTGTGQSWQVFRTTYEGQTAQLHEQRQPLAMRWSPNSVVLVLTVSTPLGIANVPVDALADINKTGNPYVNNLNYADATFAPDGTIIVSGPQWTALSVIGRVDLNQNWAYTEYQNQATNGLTMRFATLLNDGWIAFLGGPTPDAFALYLVPAAQGMTPSPVSTFITGQIAAAEWNTARSAVLVTVQTPTGTQWWIVRTDGAVQNVTVQGASAAHWQ
ncbi:MAG TPA: hypothetical protein VHP83_06205 [Aggregatilineaceae bacterium]|nr:hypothetical protein [Aggregatilineaceae bacterium]